MKFNGTKVTVYRDTKGPFDAYYKSGCLYNSLTKHQTVSYAFDFQGEHIGLIRRKLYIKNILITLLIIVTVLAGAYFILTLDTSTEPILIYQPHTPYMTDDGMLVLDITNLMSESTYIYVEDIEYEITAGDTLTSVPCFSLVNSIKIRYKNFEEVIEWTTVPNL